MNCVQLSQLMLIKAVTSQNLTKGPDLQDEILPNIDLGVYTVIYIGIYNRVKTEDCYSRRLCAQLNLGWMATRNGPAGPPSIYISYRCFWPLPRGHRLLGNVAHAVRRDGLGIGGKMY